MAATDEGFGIAVTFSSGFFAEITSVSLTGMTREAIETTHSTTTDGFRTFQPSDLVDHGGIDVEMHLDPDVGDGIPIDDASETVTVTFPTPIGGSSGATMAASGFMTNFTASAPFDDKMTASASIKWSGDITYVDSV